MAENPFHFRPYLVAQVRSEGGGNRCRVHVRQMAVQQRSGPMLFGQLPDEFPVQRPAEQRRHPLASRRIQFDRSGQQQQLDFRTHSENTRRWCREGYAAGLVRRGAHR